MKATQNTQRGADLQKGQAVINKSQSTIPGTIQTSLARALRSSQYPIVQRLPDANPSPVVPRRHPLPPPPPPRVPTPSLLTEGGPNRTKIERLRSYFLARPNVWIPMPDLVRASQSFVIHSGAATLRKQYGMVIDCERKDRIPIPKAAVCWEYRYRADHRYVFVEPPTGARKRVAVPNGKIVDPSTFTEGQ